MFYILLAAEPVPFAPDELPVVVASCAKPADLKETLRRAREAHPGRALKVSEELFAADPAKAIPGELQRAVDAWNAMVGRVATKPPTVRVVANYVAPYRRWKKRNGKREHLLEDVVAAVERQPFTHTWIKFAWLLGERDGMLNSDKVLHGFGDRNGAPRLAAGNGEDFEARER